MSATSTNAGAAWSKPLPDSKPSSPAQNGDGGQNALQALLAFACIHEQAARRRRAQSGEGSTSHAPEASKEEQFALDEVLQLVSERAVAITGADGVAIALADDDAIVCRASSGRISPDPGIKLDANAGFSGACLRSGQTVRCDDSDTDARVNAQVCRTLGARSMIAVPLSAKRRVVGLVEAFSSEAYGFNDSDVRSLSLLGELILAAIRPEEEDRLAEIAKRIVVAEPVPPAPIETAAAASAPPAKVETVPSGSALSGIETAAAVPAGPPRTTARIIVDEKFAPPRVPEIPANVQAPSGAEVFASPGLSARPAVLGEAVETKPLVAEAEVTSPEAAVNSEPKPALSAAVQKLRSFAGMGLIAALVLVAIGMGWAVWMKIRHAEQAISANTQSSIEIKTGESESREIILPAPAEVKSGPEPQVTGLRHWASGDSSTVVVDLQDQVQYEAHSLDHPSRIYFDLHDTKIAPGLANQSVEVNDPLLKRVRMAQPVEGVTRVVLETTEQAEFSVSLDPNPYRLTIEVHKPGLATVSKATPAVLPKPSPAIASPKKSADNKLAIPKEFQIVLDAGHGGWDLGTVGKKGLLEKDLVLDIVQRLGKLLETKLAAQVIYTRQNDSYVSLEKRAEIANLAGADLFLSVHANYSDLSTARGVETYYTNTYSSIKARTAEEDPALKLVDWTGVDIRSKVMDSHRLAADVQLALCGGLVATNPDLRNRGVKKAQYVVLTGTQMPAVLAEVSFVSSPEDEDHLQSSEYRQRIADALYRGIAKYRDESKNTKIASAKHDKSVAQ
jgi:N-acetylmuramoyl-L-alanine amidase/putative methionine-R-sulfoxide reductase with GAF domain